MLYGISSLNSKVVDLDNILFKVWDAVNDLAGQSAPLGADELLQSLYQQDFEPLRTSFKLAHFEQS